MPTDKEEYAKLAHHLILNLDYVSRTNFKIVYFHSRVQGKSN